MCCTWKANSKGWELDHGFTATHGQNIFSGNSFFPSFCYISWKETNLMEATEIISIIFMTMEILAWCWVSEAAQKATEVLGRHTCHLKTGSSNSHKCLCVWCLPWITRWAFSDWYLVAFLITVLFSAGERCWLEVLEISSWKQTKSGHHKLSSTPSRMKHFWLFLGKQGKYSCIRKCSVSATYN